MNIQEFRSKIKPGIKLFVKGTPYNVLEVVKFRFDDGNFYIKCFLSNNFVFADDEESNSYLLVKEIKTSFREPFENKLIFKNKKFHFLYSAHATAEEIKGREIFKKGDSESFWDYKAHDGSYLSLGIIDSTKQRLDFYGEIIDSSDLDIKS